MPAIRTYDANGNLTYDGRQDLDIRWNIFNLASGAETHDGGSLTLARLSDGTLLSQQKVSGSNTTGKRYCGSFVFTTSTGNTTPQVESVAWDEGRIFADAAGNYHDCWFAGDHLGNVRSVLDITPDVTFPGPLEQNDYLPFGTKIANPLHAQMNTNRWRYAGKEEFLDLNQLDFGARMYDPFTARWTAVDPMTRKYSGISPFGYCAGNPVGIRDNGGLDLVIAGKNNSSVTFKTDLIDKEFSVASLGLDWKGNYTLEGDDLLSAGLDLVGIVDPTGIADATNAALQFNNGDYWGAGASVLGVIPYAGDLAKAGKIGRDARVISGAIDVISGQNKLQRAAMIGQEAHRQIEKELILMYGAKKEQKVLLKNGKYIRKDAVLPDGTLVIIKPNTPSGYRSAIKREQLLENNGFKNHITIFYDPTNPAYLPSSPTYIGPK